VLEFVRVRIRICRIAMRNQASGADRRIGGNEMAEPVRPRAIVGDPRENRAFPFIENRLVKA